MYSREWAAHVTSPVQAMELRCEQLTCDKIAPLAWYSSSELCTPLGHYWIAYYEQQISGWPGIIGGKTPIWLSKKRKKTRKKCLSFGRQKAEKTWKKIGLGQVFSAVLEKNTFFPSKTRTLYESHTLPLCHGCSLVCCDQNPILNPWHWDPARWEIMQIRC